MVANALASAFGGVCISYVLSPRANRPSCWHTQLRH